MTIGVLCEGLYSDVPALDIIFKHLFPATRFDFIGTDKEDIYKRGYYHLNSLEQRGIERALVLWDLHPAGHQMPVPAQRAPKLCRYEQRQTLLEQLCRAGDLSDRLRRQALHHASRYGFPPYDERPEDPPDRTGHLFALVVLPYTLESWFLADGQVLMEIGSTITHRAPRWNPPPPDECTQPETALKGYFRQCPNARARAYNKHDKKNGNGYIAEAYCRTGRVEAMHISQSFSRMVQILRQWGAR